MEMTEFRDILKKAENGDRKALDALWRLLLGEVYNISLLVTRRRGIPEESTDDIVQDTMISIMRNYDFLSEVNNLRAWLARIINNKINDYLRKFIPKKANEISMESGIKGNDGNESIFGYLIADERMLAEDAMIINDLERKYFETLDEINSEIYRLCSQGGNSQQEIAEKTGLSLNALRIRIFRIKKGFVDFIEKETRAGGKHAR